jgi:hypothetical protein
VELDVFGNTELKRSSSKHPLVLVWLLGSIGAIVEREDLTNN